MGNRLLVPNVSGITPIQLRGMTSLATGTLSGTEVSLTSINGGYNELFLVVNNPWAASATQLGFRLNTISTTSYNSSLMKTRQIATTGLTDNSHILGAGEAYNMHTDATLYQSYLLSIPNYTYAGYKTYFTSATSYTGDSGLYGIHNSTAITTAITSIQIRCTNGTSTFGGGTYTLWGVR